jgi:Fe-S oxidoreductase
VVKVLNKAGIEVVFPEGQTCCGAPARYSGVYEVAAQNAIDNIRALLEDDVRYIVSACPTCTVALKQEFRSTFESLGKTEWLSRADQISEKTMDFSSLVKQLVEEGRLAFPTRNAPSVPLTYHDSCHMRRTLNIYQEPRDLLRSAGHDIVEMFEADACCGMGGSYSLKLPEISASILARKLDNIGATGVSEVAADCPGCVMQIRGGCDKKNLRIAVRHTAERLADLLE